MTDAKKPVRKRKKYQVRLARIQYYQFDVEGLSAEQACKRLQQRLRFANGPDAPTDATVGQSFWNIPSEEDNWLVAGGELPLSGYNGVWHKWDGDKISDAQVPRGFDRLFSTPSLHDDLLKETG